MPKVIVGMSGGVDSAVCAYLLKEAGHEVTGVTLRTWNSDEGAESRCCEIDDARQSASKLGIPYHTYNCVSEFEKYVTKPFISEYTKGRTPNPCTVCNRFVKWDKMLYVAKVLQADYIATGHYAGVVKLANGRYTVKKALHSQKDQTYMLYALTQEQLASTMMPLSQYSKDEVRGIAQEAGLAVAQKPDSQEICFVNDGSYADYIERNAPSKIKGPGNFVDEDGNILGHHKGIIHYTVGQRKGLGISMGYPIFVKEIDPVKNEVVLTRNDALFSDTVYCSNINLMSIPALDKGVQMKCTAKIRYMHAGQDAVIELVDDDLVRIRFEEPVRAAAPGQAAVFYDNDDCLIGGGIITK